MPCRSCEPWKKSGPRRPKASSHGAQWLEYCLRGLKKEASGLIYLMPSFGWTRLFHTPPCWPRASGLIVEETLTLCCSRGGVYPRPQTTAILLQAGINPATTLFRVLIKFHINEYRFLTSLAQTQPCMRIEDKTLLGSFRVNSNCPLYCARAGRNLTPDTWSPAQGCKVSEGH